MKNKIQHNAYISKFRIFNSDNVTALVIKKNTFLPHFGILLIYQHLSYAILIAVSEDQHIC